MKTSVGMVKTKENEGQSEENLQGDSREDPQGSHSSKMTQDQT